ncbi:MAG TPA: hypothetical protein PLA68_12980 [Panacibacter sp.]|nr:hypothetical protein [Panacibacter sp.]
MANTFFQWILIAGMNLFHPFFVSMTDVNYNAKDKELEISVRIFADDLENTIRKYHPNIKIDILHPTDQKQMDGFVNDYIQKHLQFQLDGKPVQIGFVGYEQQSESIWIYFEVKDVTAVTKLHITNSLLHDYNTSQINMMHVQAGGKEKSDKLDYPDKEALFVF